MAEPDELPFWDTDEENIERPPAGLLATGYVLDQVPLSRHVNWWQNKVYQWAEYFSGELETLRSTYGVDGAADDETISLAIATRGGLTSNNAWSGTNSFSNTSTFSSTVTISPSTATSPTAILGGTSLPQRIITAGVTGPGVHTSLINGRAIGIPNDGASVGGVGGYEIVFSTEGSQIINTEIRIQGEISIPQNEERYLMTIWGVFGGFGRGSLEGSIVFGAASAHKHVSIQCEFRAGLTSSIVSGGATEIYDDASVHVDASVVASNDWEGLGLSQVRVVLTNDGTNTEPEVIRISGILRVFGMSDTAP